jgi:murein DD-endopeptidase MepM/ murein hydrolase activator NlpD
MQLSPLITVLKRYQPAFHPVVSFSPDTDRLLALDLTAANTALRSDIVNDTRMFSHWVEEQLATSHSRYGIGGYGEHRTVYSASKVFDPAIAGEEPRRLHLGIDIWGKPHTAVMAPLAGIVHSFAFNNQFGDYGATIILSHNLGGVSFYTLYGHLSLSSIKNLQEGDRVDKGDLFAGFGIPAENGQWPPHLHFQLIGKIDDWSGDYPGVCRFSEKEKWLENSPDPDIILQLNQYLK